MPLEGRRFRRRKKEDVFVEGYFIDHATDVMPTADRSDEVHQIYGKDSPELDVQHNQGALTITVLDKFTSNDLLDLITGQNPAAALPRQYNADALTSVHAWGNVKSARNAQYIRSWFLGGWSPGVPVPTGDANAKAAWQLAGNGDLPRIFEGAWIKSKKVQSGGSPVLGDAPVLVPNETVYAVAVKAIRDVAGSFDQLDVTVTPGMVSSTGVVSFAEIEAQAATWQGGPLASITHAMVYFLQTGAGVYPAAGMGKLRA